MIRIEHPRPQSGRQSFIGVDFRNGVAEVEDLHPVRRAALIQHGYTIIVEPTAEPTDEAGDDLTGDEPGDDDSTESEDADDPTEE